VVAGWPGREFYEKSSVIEILFDGIPSCKLLFACSLTYDVRVPVLVLVRVIATTFGVRS
jgi:hypothetical protein